MQFSCHFSPKTPKNRFFGLFEPVFPCFWAFFHDFSAFSALISEFPIMFSKCLYFSSSNVTDQAEARLGAYSLQPIVGLHFIIP